MTERVRKISEKDITIAPYLRLRKSLIDNIKNNLDIGGLNRYGKNDGPAMMLSTINEKAVNITVHNKNAHLTFTLLEENDRCVIKVDSSTIKCRVPSYLFPKEWFPEH